MVMITGVLLLLTFVFLALYAIRIYNQLLAIKSDSFSDLLVLKQHLLRRYSQIGKILSQLQSFSGVDKDILESAHRQRQEAKNHLNNLCDMMEVSHRAKAFITLDNGLLDAYKRLSSTPEVVGQVQKNTLLRNTIASLTITEQRLAFSSKKYNRDVMQYNKLLQPLPNHFIVFIFQYMKLGFMQNPKPLARLPIDSSGM